MPGKVTHRGPVASLPGPGQVWARDLLRSSDEGFAALWDIAADAMALSDPSGTVLLANPAYYQLYGRTPAAVLGRSFAVIFPAAARAEAEAQYRAVFADPRVAPAYEATVHRGDGTERIVESRYTFLVRDGRRVAMLSVVRDITERKRLEAQLHEDVETLETLNRVGRALTAELDPRRLVQAITDAATDLTGAQFGAFFQNVTDERGESYTLYTLAGVPRDAFAGFPLPRSTAIFGPTFRGEGVIRLDDVTRDARYGQNAPHRGMPPGHLPVRSYLAVPVVSRAGDVLGGLFFGHPEAGVFAARHERLAVGLAAQAAVALDNARLYETAREATRAREVFLLTAGHELRTPLTALKGYAQLMARHLRQPRADPARLSAQFDRMLAQIDRLATLVADLLDVTRLQGEQVPPRRERVDLVALVRRVVAQCDHLPERTPGHALRVEAEELVAVSGDPVRLEQVVTNLVSNALKYSPDGGAVRCRVRADGGAAELVVSDQGIGIAPEARAALFEPFARASDDRRAIGGLGLGLHITREVVRRHGGTIALESEPGRGTTAIVRLPLLTPDAG